MNENCKVLVLGGSGFIGQNVCRWLQKAGFQVTSFDMMIPEKKCDSIEYIVGDFFDETTLDSILIEKDVVLHSLSTLNPGNSNEFCIRGYSLDFVQTMKLFEKACRQGIRVIFFSSAGTVYGRYDGMPFDEGHALRPINHYGSLKVCIETAMRSFNEQQNGHLLACRITNPYGPGQDFRKGVGFIDAALRHSIEGTELEIWGDGQVVRDYIYIDDLCRMIEKLISYDGPYHVFNLGTGIGVSQNRIVDVIRSIGLNPKVRYLPSRNVDARMNLVNTSRIAGLMQSQCLTIDEGIKLYLNSLMQKGESIQP